MDASVTQANTNNARPEKRRRNSYFISPAFQWSYVLRAAVTVFVAANLMAIVLYGILFEQARARTLAVPSPDVWQNTRTMLLFGIGFSVLLATIVGLWCVVLTHRVMGPLRLMQQGFQELQRGKLPECRPLRKRDEFKDMYQDYCNAVQALRQQRESNLAALQSALEMVNCVQHSGPSAVESELTSQVQSLQQTCRQLADELSAAQCNSVNAEEVALSVK